MPMTDQEIDAFLDSPVEASLQSDEEIDAFLEGQKEKIGGKKKKSLYKGVEQGVTFGFGDELRDLVASGIAAASPDITFKNAWSAAREMTSQEPDPSLLGEIAGGALTGKAGYDLLKKGTIKYAPGLLQKVSQFSKSHPYITSSGIGASSGGLYGFGSAEGSAKERLPEAALSFGSGAAFGPVATYGGRRISGALTKASQSPIGQRISGTLTNKTDEALPEKTIFDLTDEQTKSLGTLKRKTGDFFSKSRGQATQIPEHQRLEDDAIVGMFGDKAEDIVRKAKIHQSRERKAFLTALGAAEPGEMDDMLEAVHHTIRSGAKSLKKNVNTAYDIAREGGGVNIDAEDIKNGLFDNIMRIKRQGQYDLEDMSKASNVMRPLVRMIRTSQGQKITYSKLSAMENWRTRLTHAVHDSNGTERKFLGKVLKEYDDFMYKTANEAASNGDKDAILAFRKAVSMRRQYGKMYEADNTVKKIVSGEMGVDDLIKDLIGTGSIAGKRKMANKYDVLINAAGDNADDLRKNLQVAFAKKIYKGASSGFEAGSGTDEFISAAKMKNELERLFVQNKRFATKLYGKDVVDMMPKAIKELELISTLQEKTTNPSGSGDKVLRWVQRSKLNNIPGFSVISKAAENYQDTNAARKVAKAFSDVLEEDIEIDAPLATYFGGIIGGVAAGRSVREGSQ